MKKIFSFLLACGFLWITLDVSHQVDAQEIKILQTDAKIISANYQGSKLMFELEIDNTTYQGKFNHPLNYDEYLFLHHNAGSLIHISYSINKESEIVILRWSSANK